jgi:TRAP-type C4-dicarboxylate transport system permease small subunit
MNFVKKNYLKIILGIVFLLLPISAWGANIFKGVPTSGPDAINAIPAFIASITDIILLIVGSLATLYLIIGGYQYITATGNPEKIEKAKKTITYSIVGLIVSSLAGLIVHYLDPFIRGWEPLVGQQGGIGLIIINIIDIALYFFISLAVLFLIIGGYQYIISAGNPERIQKAKQAITGSIIGIVVVILSKTITNLIHNKLAGQTLLKDVLQSFINTVLSVTFVVAVLFLIIGGYQYITSTGNPEAIQKAKNTILNSVIGLIVIILSYAIVRFVFGILGKNI